MFWSLRSTVSSGSPNGVVRRVTSGQADVRDVAPGYDPYSVAADGKSVYWVDLKDSKIHQAARDGAGATAISPLLNSPGRIAVDAKNVYVADMTRIAAVPIGGGALVDTKATTPLVLSTSLALDSTRVYFWTAPSAGQAYSVSDLPKTLLGDPTVLAPSSNDLSGFQVALAVDAKFVYFAQPAGLYRVAIAGGAAQLLTKSGGLVHSIAVTGGAVYWIDPGLASTSGAVMKLAVFPS